MKADKTHLILKESNMYRALLILSLPVMGANFLKALHDMIDTFFVGQMENSVAAQAGISISWPLLNIFLSFNIGLAVAGVALISQFMGADQNENARHYSGMLFITSVIMGAVVNALLFAVSPAVMRLMGAYGEVYSCAVEYLRIRSFEMVFVFMFTAFQAVRQAQGDTTTPVVLSVISVTINVILTAVFIKIMNMGVSGAAYATVFGQASAAPLILRGFFKGKSKLRLRIRDVIPDIKGMRRLAVIAAPSAGSQALSSFGFLILQAAILNYGKEVSAAFSIGNKISNMLLIVVMAISTVMAAFVGQNIGAGNKERAQKSYIVSRNIALAMTLTGVTVLFPIRKFMIEMLSNDPLTIEITMEYIFWVLLSQPLFAMFQNYLGVFNGSGNTRLSLWLSVVMLWLMRLPMLLVFKYLTNLGRKGIWYSMAVSNVLIVVLGHFLVKKVDYEPKIKS